MLNINFEDNIYPIKNSINELTIEEYEYIAYVMNDKTKGDYTKYSDIFVYLGVPPDVVEEFDAFAFRDIVSKSEFDFNFDKEIFKEIELDGKIYTAYDDKFKISVREKKLMDDFIMKNPNSYISYCMSVIYKNLDVNKDMWYDSAHLKYKESLFKKISASYAAPLLAFLSKKIVNETDILENDK